MNLEKLSKAVFKLNYTDKTSEDYVYFQILLYLSEYGSFTITELDKQIHYYKETQPKKSFKIERRKLKNIIYGLDKNFEGLIPLNYVTAIPPFRNRGGYQEMDHYPTEKGIMASLGFSSYKKNINIKKILKLFDYPYSKPHKKFASEFIKLQIEIFLLYHHIQGIVLGSKHEHDADYDRFRKIIVEPFYIRVSNPILEKELHLLLKKLNIYRQIHSSLVKENVILKFIWNEPDSIKIPHYGFTGWYNVGSLTRFDKNLKSKKSLKNRKIVKSRGKPIEVSEFIYSTFQSYPKFSQNSLKREMKHLGIKST
jgi:hypothetical protein